MDDSFSDFFDDTEDYLLSIFESLESLEHCPPVTVAPSEGNNGEVGRLVSQKSNSSFQESETELERCSTSPKSKRQKVEANSASSDQEGIKDGQQRMSHITVERNRRKQMNEHLSVLRTLMPFFYVKRGDQASIIGGVVDYINELQQILQSLEAKKQRKVYSDVLSPVRIVVSSPRVHSPLSPIKPPLSPRLNLSISPRTPTPTSPYRPRLGQQPAASYSLSPTTIAAPNSSLVLEPSPTSSSSSSFENELVAYSKSALADVEVKFSGPNLALKTVSPRISGQAGKIISALEDLSLEILHANINTVDETLINSFTVKIGIECQLSAEELAQQIQQTFC